MHFYQFVLRNVFRRRTRSALTMTGMAMAVGVFVALVGMSNGFKATFLELYQNRGVDLVVKRANAPNPLSAVMPEGIAKDIAALDGVAGIAPGLVDLVSFENLGVYNKVLQGWPLESFMYKEMKPIDGERLSEKWHGKKGLMLGKNLAETLKLKAGDKITIFDAEDFTVAGVYETFSPIENDGFVLLLEDLQKITTRPGVITGVTIKLKACDNPEELKRKTAEVRHSIEHDIAAKYKCKLEATPAADLAQSAIVLRAVNGICWGTSLIAGIMIVLFMLNTMIMSVFERTREIGILRAIGWRPWRIVKMILMEAVLLSMGGGAVGMLGAAGIILLLSRLPITKSIVRGDAPFDVMIMGFLSAILVGVLGAAYPAYRGASLMPTEAIRHE